MSTARVLVEDDTDTIVVTRRRVACDGGGGALGHPRVFLDIKDHEIVCPYCSRRFRLAEGASGGDPH